MIEKVGRSMSWTTEQARPGKVSNIWNSLNNEIIKSVSVLSFKNKINKICVDKQLFLNRNL